MAVLLTAGPAVLLAAPAGAAPGPVQTFPTAAGPVKITPIYHAAAMIEAGADRIYIDPAKPADIRGLAPGDLILITDIHGDHMDADDIKALSKDGTVIIAPTSVQQTITAAKALDNGASTSWHKWKITAVPMYNIKNVQPNGTPFHTKGRGDGYVLS
jgi:L-ascorbate metabolism protein UlaG (beta-lactamase superfamily)